MIVIDIYITLNPFTIFSAAPTTPPLVIPTPSSSGIYFDYIGKTKIINGYLSVVIPLDISYIKPHIENIDLVLNKAKFICEQVKPLDDSGCHNILHPLTIRFKDIIIKFSSISHLLENRVKRGAWVGGVGTVMKQIFGTLDENDGDKYDKAIEVVQNDQKRLASLIKEHILVTKSVLSTFNETIRKIKINEDNLSLAIDKLSQTLKKVTDTTNLLLINADINALFATLESSILTLSFRLEDITNSILFSSVNIIHPSIITPQKFYEELANNYRHLPNGFELAVNLDLSLIHVILNISRLVSYYVKNRIMFVLQIPLVSPQQFYLYQSIPLPIPHDNARPDSFSLIIPSHKYIVITKDKLHYGNLNSLEKCRNTNQENYICQLATVFPTSANPSCECELLSKVITKIPAQCETKFIRGDINVWKPLRNNRWIFVQSTSSKLSLDCLNSELSEINILGTGIINIPVFCKGYCKNTQLLPKYNVFNINLPDTKLDFNLINDSCCSLSKFTKIANDVPRIKLESLDLEKLSFKDNTDKRIISELDKILQEPHIIRYGAHYSTFTIAFILVIICIILFKFHKRILNRPSNLHKQEQTHIPLVILPTASRSEILDERHTDEQLPSELKEKPFAKIRVKV